MPRGGARPGTGGARPGAGRPKKGEKPVLQMVAAVAVVRAGRVTPLEYMLDVINDPEADTGRKDRMAQAAAPYVHPKAEPSAAPGKKELRAEAAQTAERGTDWETLLSAAPN